MNHLGWGSDFDLIHDRRRSVAIRLAIWPLRTAASELSQTPVSRLNADPGPCPQSPENVSPAEHTEWTAHTEPAQYGIGQEAGAGWSESL